MANSSKGNSNSGSRKVSIPAGDQGFRLVGCALAGYCSWTLNASVGWAAIHALFGWVYMLYLCGGCGGGLPHGLF